MRGITLIEAIIGLALFAFVIVGLVQALNVGIIGTYRASQSNIALDLARSQLEYIKVQDYQVCEDNPCNELYSKLGSVAETYPGFSAEGIEIIVEDIGNESPEAIQQVTVRVLSDNMDRTAWLVSYKAPRVGFTPFPPTGEWIATGVIDNLPDPLGSKEAYYYTIETGSLQGICATWIYTSIGPGSGNLMSVYILKGSPFGIGEGLIPELLSMGHVDADIIAGEKAAEQPDGETYMVALKTGLPEPGVYTALFYNDSEAKKDAKDSRASVTYYWEEMK